MRVSEVFWKRAMRIGMFVLTVVALLVHAPAAFASAGNNGLKIYEVYGAGALAGATERQDTIILFNPTQAAISCDSCAIQVHTGSNTTSAWTVYKLLSFSIPAGGYYMIAASSPTLASIGNLPPIPYDYRLKTIEGTTSASDNLLSSTTEAVALTNTQTALTPGSDSMCGGGSQLVDLVGYGSSFATNKSGSASTTACFAGDGEAFYDGSSTPGRQLGVTRKNKCIDTFSNADDFVNVPVTYFNSSSAPTSCPTGTQLSAVVSATPSGPDVNEAVTFQAVVTGATQLTSTGLTATLDFSSPYYAGTDMQMFDDGTHGDATAGDGIFTLRTTVPSKTVTGYGYPTNVTVADAQGNAYTGSTIVSVGSSDATPQNSLKIYEVFGAGGLAGAKDRQDTIILFNPTQSAIACDACAIQTHSGTSTTAAWTVYKLPSFSVPAGGYYMIFASSPNLSADGAVAPIHEDYDLGAIEGTISDSQNILSSTTGVIALTNSQKALTVSAGSLCGSGTQLWDLVGYGSDHPTGSGTNATPSYCYAGSGEAYYDGSTNYGRPMGVTRKNKCVNTFDNRNDFVNMPVTYFNSTSAPAACPTGTQLSASISASPSNPNVGDEVKFTAAVTGATMPSSTGIKAVLDFDAPYYADAAQPMFDDGTHGDAKAGDGIYTVTATIPAETTSGFTFPTNVTVNDAQGDSFTGSTPLTISAGVSQTSGNNNIRIVAWYGAGNLSKSEYARDTIILFNPTQAAITMDHWSLQSGGASGSFTAATYLLPVATIPAGGFYAITGSGVDYISSAGCASQHCNLNYPYDYQVGTLEGTATSTDNHFSSTASTIALVDNQDPLGTGCPLTSGHLIDLLGVGASDGSSPVTCYGGNGYAPYTPATTNGAATNINGVVYAYATIRRNKCGNTFDNQNDFMLGFIDFANSQTAPEICPLGKQLTVASTAANPGSAGILDPFTITASVMPATKPDSGALMVTADLSNLGLSATSPLYDDGTHGDAVAGDHTYSLATAATGGNVGATPGLIVTAIDQQQNTARNLIPFTVNPGTVTLDSPNTTGAVNAGEVITFPITVTGHHGYGGILSITCTGSPNTNSLGVPVSTQCVSTPPQLKLGYNGSTTISLAIATGTTKTAGVITRSVPLGLLGLMSMGVLTVAVWRRRHLPSAVLVALVSVMAFNTTACGKNAGLGSTAATPGTYTYTVTATDSQLPSITQSMTFTVTVK